MDPKDHEEVVAERERLAKALAEAEKAKAALESRKAELARGKAMAEKQRDEANMAKTKVMPQVIVHVLNSMEEISILLHANTM